LKIRSAITTRRKWFVFYKIYFLFSTASFFSKKLIENIVEKIIIGRNNKIQCGRKLFPEASHRRKQGAAIKNTSIKKESHAMIYNIIFNDG